jgi:hypothetical protein
MRDGRTHPSAPGLYFTGYWLPQTGELPAMRRNARRIARSIARELRRDGTSGKSDGHSSCGEPSPRSGAPRDSGRIERGLGGLT